MSATHAETEAVNADSFLDIVASIVSIMIIMVVMTGLKIKYSPVEGPLTTEVAPADTQLATNAAQEQSLRQDVLKLATEIENIERETAVKRRERDVMALAVASLEQKVEGADAEVKQQSKQDADLAGRLFDAKNHLAEIERRHQAIESTPLPPVQVESYPTPISRAVDGHEVHFRLKGGRIAFVPVQSLLEQFKADAQRKLYKLSDSGEMTDTIGPDNGFRLRYTLERHEVTAEEAHETGRAGAMIRLKICKFLPVSEEMGETLDEALAAGSQFRLALSDRRAQGATITLWTYPDSFDTFRRLKKELYRQGFAVAARPLPDGTPIGGSPEGTKSTAE